MREFPSKVLRSSSPSTQTRRTSCTRAQNWPERMDAFLTASAEREERRARGGGTRDAATTRDIMRTINDVMEPDVYWVPDDMPLERAAHELASRQISGAPVCGADGKLVGMLSMKDLTEFYGGVHETRLVREVMTPEILAVLPDDPIQQAIKLMAFEGVHRLLVIDRDQRLVGIVTSMDILRELAGFPRQPARVLAVAPPP
jgi:CBS domain-containing protein